MFVNWTPLNPARPPVLLPSALSVAVSNVNVTNPDNYVWADPQAYPGFCQSRAVQHDGVRRDDQAGAAIATFSVRLGHCKPRWIFQYGARAAFICAKLCCSAFCYGRHHIPALME